MRCRQYSLKIDSAAALAGVEGERQRLAGRQLAAAQDVVATLERDQIGPVVVFYLAGAARNARTHRAAAQLAGDELQGRLFSPEAAKGWARTDLKVGEQLDRARAADPAAWHVATRRPGSDGVLAIGVDTLYASAWVHLDPVIVEQLEAIRTIARETATACYIANGVHLWKVEPYGIYPFCVVLRGNASTIKIKRSQSTDTNPQASIEFRSAWLWRDGPDRCVATVAALLRQWTDDRQRHRLFRITVSRIDLAVDVDGRHFALEGGELREGRWLTRALSKAQYYRGELAKMGRVEQVGPPQKRAARSRADRLFDGARQFAEHWSGLTYTGVQIGRSAIAARIYRKDVELKRPGIHKPWMRALWRSLGWDGEAPVWRVEAQITGEKLRQLAMSTKRSVQLEITPHLEPKTLHAGGVLKSHEWADVRMSLGGIWRYFAGRPDRDRGGWLTYRDPTGNKQRSRWPINEGWRTVQRARWDLGAAHGLDGVEVHAVGKTRPEALRAPGAYRPDAVSAMDQRPHAWEACQPIAPDGDGLAAVLEVPEGAALSRWGWGPATFDDLADFDVDTTAAASREEQIMPQIVGCLIKLLAELHLQGVDAPGFDEAMMRVAFAMPSGAELHDRVMAKAAAIALDAAKIVEIRRVEG